MKDLPLVLAQELGWIPLWCAMSCIITMASCSCRCVLSRWETRIDVHIYELIIHAIVFGA